MPKGEFTRPKGSKRSLLSDPTGKADEALRRAAASGDPKNWNGPDSKMSKKQFEEEMRKREQRRREMMSKLYDRSNHK